MSARGGFEIGLGTSSIFAGRPVPALALGYYGERWGALYRSAGVQTPIYAQNAWSLAGLRIFHDVKFGPGTSEVGAGLGVTSVLRAYRPSLTSPVEKTQETIVGPHFMVKVNLGYFYFGFDTLLGLSSQIEQHIALNFRDVSHVTLGATF